MMCRDGKRCMLPATGRRHRKRLRGVQIENRPAVDLIQKYNYSNVLIYADPPYVLSTRHGKQYKYDMNDRQQEDLLDTLLAHKGSVLLSGYDNNLYRSRLSAWHREEVSCQNQLGQKTREVLWMNFEPMCQLNFNNIQEGL